MKNSKNTTINATETANELELVTVETMAQAIAQAEIGEPSPSGSKEVDASNLTKVATAKANGVGGSIKYNKKGEIICFEQKDGTFRDVHGRNVNNVGWTAGRCLGVGMNQFVQAYKLDPSLAERINEISIEFAPIIASYKVAPAPKKPKETDPVKLKAQLEKTMASMAKKQKALEDAIATAELLASEKA